MVKYVERAGACYVTGITRRSARTSAPSVVRHDLLIETDHLELSMILVASTTTVLDVLSNRRCTANTSAR